jgi:hypothetical protein
MRTTAAGATGSAIADSSMRVSSDISIGLRSLGNYGWPFRRTCDVLDEKVVNEAVSRQCSQRIRRITYLAGDAPIIKEVRRNVNCRECY